MPQAQDPKRNNNRGRTAGQPGRQTRRPGNQNRQPGQQARRNAQPAASRRPERQTKKPVLLERQRQQRRYEDENTIDLSATIKGIIAVFLTLLIVAIIVMLFARSLFVSDEALAKNIKTGHLTETAYIPIEQQSQIDEEVVTTKKPKKKTSKKDEEPIALPEGLDTTVAGTYMVNDAVYLHPEPNSASENLLVLPYGSEVKVYGTNNGWYYLDYEGQLGYAWSSYLNPMS